MSIPLPIDNTRHDAPRHERPRVAPTAELDASIGLSGLKVLCVDDSNINLKVISRPLIKAGASVTTACSGTEALELIRVHEFDIVLTDISMPGMDGEQLQQELKAWKLGLPVVAVTGNVLPEDVGRYIANGFVAALGKPLDIDQLMEVVRDKVGQAKASLN